MKHVLAIALLAACTVARADIWTGNEFKRDCVPDAPGFLYCVGLVQGIRFGVNAQALRSGQAGYFCIPDEVTAGQLANVVSKYLNDHPEQLHLSANVLTVVALAKAFPCSK